MEKVKINSVLRLTGVIILVLFFHFVPVGFRDSDGVEGMKAGRDEDQVLSKNVLIGTDSKAEKSPQRKTAEGTANVSPFLTSIVRK